MNLTFLTNPDQNLQSKMRFFSDYFLFTNQYLGRLPDMPFDNPQSLISKIIFQIENNIERSPRYIESHFKHLTVHFGDFMRKQVPEFAAVENEYATYNQCPPKEKKRVNWIKSNPGFLSSLHEVSKKLEEILFPKIFLWLTHYMQCRHKLSTHEKDIQFCTQILVSLFRMSGHSKKQVSGYIDRILSSDRYKFPFPIEIYDHNRDPSFTAITDEYLNNRDSKKQFEGLKNLMINQQRRKGYFIFAINHVVFGEKIKNTFKQQLDNVTFISPSHPQFKKLKRSVRKVDKKSYFKMYSKFFGKRKLLAYTNIPYEDKDYAKANAAKIISEELLCLNEYLDTKLELWQDNFLFTESFDNDGWSGKGSFMNHSIHHLSGIKLDWIKENPFEVLREHSFEGKSQLLHSERIFMKATIEDDVSLFWQYIENLFWFQNEENDDIRKKFGIILMKTLKGFHEFFLLNIGHLFFGLQRSKFSHEISPDNSIIERISSELGYQHNVKFPIGKYKTAIIHPFLKEMISRYEKIKSRKYRQEWDDYFASLILEMQEFRNAALHAGKVNPYTKIKMTELMPEIMNRARWTIIDACRKNKKLSFNELMKRLSS